MSTKKRKGKIMGKRILAKNGSFKQLGPRLVMPATQEEETEHARALLKKGQELSLERNRVWGIK